MQEETEGRIVSASAAFCAVAAWILGFDGFSIIGFGLAGAVAAFCGIELYCRLKNRDDDDERD